MHQDTIIRWAKRSWRLPLLGVVLTVVSAVGWSLANIDVRPQVQWVGLGALGAAALIGVCLSTRALRLSRQTALTAAVWHASAGLLFALVLAGVVALGVYTVGKHARGVERIANRAPSDPAPLVLSSEKLSVWIDTDPACGAGEKADPDDCWALLAVLRTPQLVIQGISTVFGNLEGDATHRIARQTVGRFVVNTRYAHEPPPIFAGAPAADESGTHTPATQALAAALRQQRLTILALGPLTNIASVLNHHPHLAERIERIVFVGGTPPGRLLHPGTQWWFHFRDLNVAKDAPAVDAVLRSGVPVIAIPFEVAEKIRVTQRELDRLATGDPAAKWLSEVSAPWASYWQRVLHRDGFYPFDAMAAMYLLAPSEFVCDDRIARVGFSVFLEPLGMGRDFEIVRHGVGTKVHYCFDIKGPVKQRLMSGLLEPDSGAQRCAADRCT